MRKARTISTSWGIVALVCLLASGVVNSPVACAAGVHALFDLDTPTGGPFPSNWFTVADRSQNTGRRVHLPLPDCHQRPSDCEDLNVINELDGFNLQPRLSIPFDGPIDVHSVTSQDVFLLNLGDTVDHREHGDPVVGINQIVWDPPSQTLHVKSDALLEQHTRYALIVTNSIHDTDGHPVEASAAFRRFRHAVQGEYKHELLEAIHAARRYGIRERDIVTASVFTTESATAITEKIRDQIKAGTPEPADFNLGPGGTRTVFPLRDVTGILFHQQTGDDPPQFTDVQLDLSLLRVFPGAVDRVAFGRYHSPDYEVHPGEYIPPVGTRTGTPAVQSVNEIYFNLFLPSGPKPAGGWPVAIYSHGGNGSKNTTALPVVATMAANGIATIMINVVGHGFGPLGMLTVNQKGVDPVTFSAGGRGIDQNHDHVIGTSEGLNATAPHAIIRNRDGETQTVADLLQLVRVIQLGIDSHGDGRRDLDPSRLYFFGTSFGGMLGIQLLAVEPSVGAGVLVSACGPVTEFARLSPVNRPGIGNWLAPRIPPLLNPPGVIEIGSVTAGPPHFHDNLPLRDGVPFPVRLADGTDPIVQSPVINTVPGALAIQGVLENTEWVMMSGNPLAYAPHVRKDPLAGVPAKSVIFQFAKGDQSCPNPTETALVRAGDWVDWATYYRHDLAYAEDTRLLKNPHTYLIRIDDVAFREIALGAQQQIAAFFASDGKTIIHPEPARFFEVPIAEPLPEELNYIP